MAVVELKYGSARSVASVSCGEGAVAQRLHALSLGGGAVAVLAGSAVLSVAFQVLGHLVRLLRLGCSCAGGGFINSIRTVHVVSSPPSSRRHWLHHSLRPCSLQKLTGC